jgi:RNA polymerase sigma-70 factor (ECF subfamily)
MNHQTSMPDEKLIQFYLNGDPNAMATLVELYKDRVYRSIYNIVQDRYAAEEIFQEVFICLINNMIAGKAAAEGNFLQWATHIAQDFCIAYTRKNKQVFVMDSGGEEAVNFSVPAAMPAIHYHESHDKIKSMIDLLPDNQREVLVLNHYCGMCYKEIADLMKCTLNTALDNMKSGLTNLRKMMTEKELAID